MKHKIVLDTDLVKIIDDGAEYLVHIKMQRGGILEHEPFKRDLHGLVGAMQLATEICAGKFFPRGVLNESLTITASTKQLNGRK